MLKYFLFGIVFLFFMNSCKMNLSLNAYVHHPYCGGAEPTPEMQEGWNKPMDTLIIRKALGDKKIVVALNENGETKITLSKGKYMIYHKDKALNNEQFIKKYTSKDKWYIFEGDSCLLNWKKTPDGIVELTKKDQAETIIIRTHCFIGINPCVDYVGPPPP